MPATGPHHVPNDAVQRRSAVTDDVRRCHFPTRTRASCDGNDNSLSKAASKSTDADFPNDNVIKKYNMPEESSNNNHTAI